MDELLRETNELADHTVFIAEWLRDYFVERWFDPKKGAQCGLPLVHHLDGSGIVKVE